MAYSYRTTLDRAGLALGAGGLLAGLVALGLVLAGGERHPLALVSVWLFGSLFSALAMAAIAGPCWLVLHLAGHRRGWHAATLGAILAMIVFVAGQTYGFGLFDASVSGGGTLFFRWLSAVATSSIVAIVAAGTGWVMWRVAYRPTE